MDENSALTLCKAEYSYSSGMVYGENITIQITDKEIVYASFFPWEGIKNYSGDEHDEIVVEHNPIEPAQWAEIERAVDAIFPLLEIIEEYKSRKDLQIWKDNHFASLSRLVTEILSVKSEVARLADTVGSFDELTMKLVNLIHETNRLMPESLDLVICQCFMKDYSLGGEVRKKIYSAWYQSVRNKQ